MFRKYPLIWLLVLLLLPALACGGDEEATPTPEVRPADQTSTDSSNEDGSNLVPVPPRVTRVFDPALPDWTVMVYIDGDNNLEEPALLDMNEMEAAGDSDQVNVLVQIDRIPGETSADGNWTDTRRYKIEGDNDPNRITSPVVMQMGEVNMGDPASLTDFVSWGITNYPANRYALVLWNHGAGWFGVAFDDSSPGGDGLIMPELNQALSQALNQTGAGLLDVIGFDACLMGQMEVYQQVQPYALYAVGSEELVPGLGWDYEAILSRLYAEAEMDGRKWSEGIVADFINFYTKIAPDEFTTMSAVDLSQYGTLTTAVTDLANSLRANPSAVASAVGDARNGAEGYALIYPEDAEFYAAIDLWHFASILAQRSRDSAVTAAAQKVMQAVESVVVATDHGAGFTQANGISIYFPRTLDYFSQRYASETPLRPWSDFLASYHGIGLANIPAPQFDILNVLSDQAGIQQPAYLDVEITGQDIENVLLVGGRYQNGGQHLLTYDYLIPEPTALSDGSLLYEWRDGLHKDFFVWQTESPYLYDVDRGDFVAMFPTEYNSPLYSVQGRYRRAGTSEYFDANLVFDTDAGQLSGVWTFQNDSRAAPNEIFPQPGDEFQIYDLYLESDGNLSAQPGLTVTFDNNNLVYYTWLPLTSGDYFLGFLARNISGETTSDARDFQVNNDNLIAGYKAYLDPYLGFQFLYPEGWYAPTYGNGVLYTYDIETNNTTFNLYLYPNAGGATADSLKTQTLETFGNPTVEFENPITIGGVAGTGTAYSYEGDNGSHVGFLLSFVNGGVGYVIDVDGLATDENVTLNTIGTLIDSWVFQPVGFGLPPGIGFTADASAQPSPAEVASYNDTFDGVGSWATGSNDEVSGQVAGGVYELEVTADSGIYWTTGGQDFGNGTYEVAATAVDGPLNNGYGMLIRLDGESNSFYAFEVSSDGYVWIGRCDDGCNNVEALVSGGWFASNAVNQGLNQTNFLRVEAKGPAMIFYLNGVEVGRASDSTLTGGDIGLFVETLGDPGVRVWFDNFLFTPANK